MPPGFHVHEPAKIVCAYVMTHDSGHAPNPFHNTCTLAICTPNHMRSRCRPGDWIIGLASASIRRELGEPDVWRLIYAMNVEKKLDLDSYYRDPQFAAKIPRLGSSLVESCGDNFYCKDSSGQLHHTRQTDEHQAQPPGTGIEKQDICGDRVFVGQRFWYFGRNAPAIPLGKQWAERLISKFSASAVGLRYVYEEGAEIGGRWSDSDLSDFSAWLPANGGLLGRPTHWPQGEEGRMNSSGCNSYRTNSLTDIEKISNAKADAIPACRG
ncbi:Nmad2 family putative nucleotide modification protein [Cupriavidus alkaliphilus]|uniref:Nmad2 family putative nucleotide modification protein n=1 Tax=Cupriavidus alkaliphilus TaxID=942866 RepID=UPI00244671B0|nr:hypothetical protein [Cupriavidus alkaliphilus]